MKEKSRSTFSGNIGFVLAAAGSAVGLGNIWRFPYLHFHNKSSVEYLMKTCLETIDSK